MIFTHFKNYFFAALLLILGTLPLSAQEVEIRRAIPVEIEELEEVPEVFVEVFKVKTNSKGKVVDSILNVTDADGEPKEFVLVSLRGRIKHAWVTSTAQSYKQRKHATKGMIYPSTAEGKGFKPHALNRDHVSSVYKNGRMPFAIFFNGGMALHATTPDHYPELGIKDSGACTRLYRPNAEELWEIINPDDHEELYMGSAAIAAIRSRVLINVYGFDNESKTSARDRTKLKEKYAYAEEWIQSAIRKDLAKIQAAISTKKKKN